MKVYLKSVLISFAIFLILAVAAILFVFLNVHKKHEAFKPYASYRALINLASGIDDYRKQAGVWPASISQLVDTRPDLENDVTDGYGNFVVLVPYNEQEGFGELISYGHDGKPGGSNQFDKDIEIRFPLDLQTNIQWNEQAAERFKSKTARGL